MKRLRHLARAPNFYVKVPSAHQFELFIGPKKLKNQPLLPKFAQKRENHFLWPGIANKKPFIATVESIGVDASGQTG